MAESKISGLFEQAAKNFEGMVNANSVVGDPIVAADGTLIVPVSKVSFGFGGGGFEYDGKKTGELRPEDKNFSGGMGGGASVKAEAFLVINNKNVRLISVDGGTSPVDKVMEMVPGIVDKVNGFIASRKEKKAVKEVDMADGDNII